MFGDLRYRNHELRAPSALAAESVRRVDWKAKMDGVGRLRFRYHAPGRHQGNWYMQASRVGAFVLLASTVANAGAVHPTIGAHAKPTITIAGLSFHDLNGDGKLEPYEDWRRAPQARVTDLIRRMTLEEKAGQMMHGAAPSDWPDLSPAERAAKGYQLDEAKPLVKKGVGAFLTRLSGAPAFLGAQNNKLQEMAEATRLGIPLIISSDPRNHFSVTDRISIESGGFSRWPETLGFAALGDSALVRHFGDVVRQEYRAAGIEEALSPQADLATEPRWRRVSGTFGEDADLTSRMVQSYVQGFQGGEKGLRPGGVITVVKHWAGYGAAKDGWDSHGYYGRYASYSGGGFEYHLKAWSGAFTAGAAGIMPTYSIPEGASLDGKPLEQVGAGYSHQLLTDLLRGRYNFKGVILTDFSITNDCLASCKGSWSPGQPIEVGMPWGVEDLNRPQRFAKAVNAGVDQIGGVTESEQLVEAVRSGAVSIDRIDASVRRILLQKFELGLFEDSYVEPAAAAALAKANFQAEANHVQSRSLVVLENRNAILPLAAGRKVYLQGVSAVAARSHGLVVVDAPEQADVAIVRAAAPYQQLHPNYFFGRNAHDGDLDYKDGDSDFEMIKAVSAKIPTILTIYLERPAILTNVKDRVAALLGSFGVSDDALLDALTGRVKPEGKLPFELPSSMAEVAAQKPDLPHDTDHPLYPFGFSRSF